MSIPSPTRRAQVGVHPELLANREQPLLGPDRLAFELRQSDGGEQDGVGSAAGCERLVGQRRSLVENRVAAERMLGVLDPERVEHAHRLGCDLGPDPVAGKNGDVRHDRTAFL